MRKISVQNKKKRDKILKRATSGCKNFKYQLIENAQEHIYNKKRNIQKRGLL